MSLTRARAALVLALLAVGFTFGGCSEKIGRGWDWNRMRTQPKYQAYGASDFFPNGMAMRAPPVGTVAREVAVASWPVQSGPAVLAAGAHVFQVYCSVCHGEAADGKSIVASNMDDFRPPSLLTDAVRLLPDSIIYTVVTNGLGHMPAFSGTLSVRERQDVAVYVAQLTRTPHVPVDSIPRHP
ncbi:MAG: c-type cytochrome [Gemmatimonadaceae bacterium]